MDNRHPPPRLEVNLDQAVYVLSGALDLVGVDDVQHGKRVAYLALHCAEGLGFDAPALNTLRNAALLHDFGVSSTHVHRHLVNEMEWDNVEAHCVIGAELIALFPPLAELAPLIRYHHTHWPDLAVRPLPPAAARISNLIFLCDRVDALRVQHPAGDGDDGLAVQMAAIREAIARYSGRFFEPTLVESFLAASGETALWRGLRPEAIDGWFHDRGAALPPRLLDLPEARELARLFAHVVDAKSHFTASHSEGVARLTVRLARQLGLPEERVELLEIAALLHDIGKLRVPDEVLDKRGQLGAAEWDLMRRHSGDSRSILHRIDGFDDIAEWAGMHHETPRGDGYPLGRGGDQLPLEARIISVADVFQALAQDRPYRAALDPDTILSILRSKVAEGHLDEAVVERVAADLQGCWRAAMLGEEDLPSPAGGIP